MEYRRKNQKSIQKDSQALL